MTYWSFSEALKFIGRKVAMPPIGLLTVASMLPDVFDLRLIDMNAEKLKDSDIIWADAVFVSAMIAQQESLTKVMERCNDLSAPVILGGPYPSSYYKNIKANVTMVLNEAEDVFDYFLPDLISGTMKKVYARPARESEYNELIDHFGKNENIALIDDRTDMTNTPVPRFDLLKMKYYSSMSVQYSRGCPIGCEFCDIWRRFGKKVRVKSGKKLIEEFDELYRLGWRGSLFIVDDNFIGNKRKVKNILIDIIKWQKEHNHPYSLYTETTINLADDEELLKLMVDAGFYMAFIGIETPVEASLRETGKFLNTSKKISLIDRIRKIQRAGIEVSSGFILGFDNDPDNIADLQIEFIQNSGVPLAMVGLLGALRDTDLYDRLEREGRITRESDGINTHLTEPNFITRINAKKLADDYKRLLKTIYDTNMKNYFARCTTMLDNLGRNTAYSSNLNIRDIMAMLRSFAYIPVKRFGYQYFKFLWRTVTRTPHHFPTAIRLAVMGYHFRAITKYTAQSS